MEETKKLGHEKITKLLLKYSMPAIVGMVINSIYNIVDRMFIGNSADIGSLGIGGINITAPIYTIMMGIALLFGTGGSILFSIALGQKKVKKAKRALGISTSILAITGIAITVFGLIFLDPILKALGAEGQLFDYAKEYIRIILIGSVFQSLSMGLNGFVRADGHPKTAMTTMVLGCIINIILDPIFIYVFGWGMFGAALATIIGQLASTVWILAHFLSKRATYKLELKNMKLNVKYIAKITVLGLSVFIFHMAGSLMALVLNKRLLEYGGDIAVSGMGIINSVTMFVILPVLGLVQGASPIVSYNYGARNKKRILSTVKLCMIISTIIMVISLLLTVLFSEQIVQMFNDEEELINFTSRALIIWFLGLPVVGMQITISNYFQSIGKYKISIFLTLIRQVIILIPMIILLSQIWKIDGALYASPVSDILGFILTAGFFAYEYRKKYRKIKKVEA